MLKRDSNKQSTTRQDLQRSTNDAIRRLSFYIIKTNICMHSLNSLTFILILTIFLSLFWYVWNCRLKCSLKQMLSRTWSFIGSHLHTVVIWSAGTIAIYFKQNRYKMLRVKNYCICWSENICKCIQNTVLLIIYYFFAILQLL